MSDRGLPVNPMHMKGYGSHTFSLWNQKGERYWVKFHCKIRQGHKHYTNAEAEKIVGKTPRAIRRIFSTRSSAAIIRNGRSTSR